MKGRNYREYRECRECRKKPVARGWWLVAGKKDEIRDYVNIVNIVNIVTTPCAAACCGAGSRLRSQRDAEANAAKNRWLVAGGSWLARKP
jgi:hypothetical protein